MFSASDAMPMTARLRKLSLTAHVTSSVGWLGAVAGVLALTIVGLTSRDADVVRGAYLAMNVIGQFIVVPLSLAALVTGLVQSLGTPWGVFRYYWVELKLALTVVATILLLLHQFTAVAGAARHAAAAPAGTMPDVGRLGVQLMADSALAIVVLLVTTTLGIYKPWGKTSSGRRNEPQAQSAVAEARASGLPLGLVIFLAVIGAAAVAFALLHLAGRGLGGHGP